MNYKEEIINALADVCKRARREGYAEGLKKGEDIEQLNAAETKNEVARLNYNYGYKSGLGDAWDCARKMYQFNPINNKQLCEELYDMGFNEFICSTTASEAIAKIKEYEEKQKQLPWVFTEIHLNQQNTKKI